MDHTRALTGVRIVFALMVVLFHLSSPQGWLGLAGLAQGPGWLRHALASGHVGVQFFFVLSGFILALTYHDLERPQDRAFFAARAARIYPVYLLGVLAMLPVMYLNLFHVAGGAGWPLATLALQLAACVLLVQVWFPRWAMVGNGPGWSLSAEAFFYLCFPRLVRVLRRHGTLLLVTGALAAVLARQALCWFGRGAVGVREPGPSNGPDFLFWDNLWSLNPLLHLPDFIVGMVAFLLLRRGAVPRAALWWGTWAATLALALAMGLELLSDVLVYDGALVLPCALLVMGLTVESPLSRLLGSDVMQRLGQASYAVYLLHVPLLWYLTRLDERGPQVGARHPLLMLAFYLALLLALSLAVFAWYEEPLRRRLRARLAT